MANSPEFDLVIFDCDGVLVNSEPLVNRLYVDVLGECGCPLNYDETLAEFCGAAMSTRMEVYRQRFNWVAPDDFHVGFRRRLHDLMERELHPVPGVREVLSRLTVPYCVASNGTPEEIRFRLRTCGLAEFFGEAIFSGTVVARPKPFPDVYLAAAAAFATMPARCAVVEDSVTGVHAAVQAGMTVFGYAAFTNAEALREAGAKPFRTMAELPSLLRGCCP